jgi:hypothetical protein
MRFLLSLFFDPEDEVTYSTGTVYFQWNARRYIPEDRSLRSAFLNLLRMALLIHLLTESYSIQARKDT